jgi:hypothetical protein
LTNFIIILAEVADMITFASSAADSACTNIRQIYKLINATTEPWVFPPWVEQL